MIPLIFIYSHDSVFQDVKQEASLLAVRKRDQKGNSEDNDGNSYFDLFVFDDAYLVKFRELFFDAQAEVTPVLSAYMKLNPPGHGYFETLDFTKDVDCTFDLIMPDDFLMALSKPVDIKIRQFFIAYIMYRWLETKMFEEASIYRERAYSLLDEIKSLLEKRVKPIRRWHGYW
ncbi:MAG: hypothetical protein LBQ73_00875 [Tannerellaceae bacterium]|jgi:hypothetical protein|nr:hypothetical protein [Tannerellaceae bacterium]